MRAAVVTAMLIAVVQPASAAPDPDDVRPSDHAIVQPAGDWAQPPIPADLHLDPPADGWWKRKDACPAHTRLVVEVTRATEQGQRWRTYHCKGKTSDARPSTSMTIAGPAERQDRWRDADGLDHGAFRLADPREVKTGVRVHGIETGRRTTTAADGSVELIEAMRDKGVYGLVAIRTGALWASGYLEEGHRLETWLVWHASDGVVRARLRYDRALIDGAQRWWNPDGTVLARATFKRARGTWKLAHGTWRSETRCMYGAMDGIEAWDAAGALTLRICSEVSADGCTPFGPTDPAAQRALGAAPGICKNPDAEPLGP
jgi:hypothetical protein